MIRILIGLTLFLLATTEAWSQTRVAFVAGVERYKKSGLNDLEYAEDDARELKKALEMLGFTTTGVIGEDASLANLNRLLDEFIDATKKLNKSDIAIVYFSGHGVQKLVQLETADGRTIEAEEPFFCPNDAIKTDMTTLLSLNTILNRLEASSGSDHNIIMLDACRDSADKSGRGGIDGSTIRELSDKLALFFAAKSGRRSFESRQLSHGIFTHYLLEGLRGKAADSDNEITFQGLASYVAKQVERNSPVLLAVSAADAQCPNLMGNLTGTLVLGRVVDLKPSLPREKTITNSLGMKLVRIETGEFLMGNEVSVEELMRWFPYAVKQRLELSPTRELKEITQPYYLGIHEVTVGQFRRFIEATKYQGALSGAGHGINHDGSWENSKSYTWKTPGFTQSEDHPVVNVSWYDAERFCEWLSRLEGKKYRLPTEAEWEYAWRAGTSTQYWHGNDSEGLAKVGNIADATVKLRYSNWKNTIVAADGFANTSPVGSFAANPWGLHDMIGNVLEWCSNEGGANGGFRGGSWARDASTSRAAYRIFDDYSFRSSDLGFRVVIGL